MIDTDPIEILTLLIPLFGLWSAIRRLIGARRDRRSWRKAHPENHSAVLIVAEQWLTTSVLLLACQVLGVIVGVYMLLVPWPVPTWLILGFPTSLGRLMLMAIILLLTLTALLDERAASRLRAHLAITRRERNG